MIYNVVPGISGDSVEKPNLSLRSYVPIACRREFSSNTTRVLDPRIVLFSNFAELGIVTFKDLFAVCFSNGSLL